jgi:hypothetical protein
MASAAAADASADDDPDVTVSRSRSRSGHSEIVVGGGGGSGGAVASWERDKLVDTNDNYNECPICYTVLASSFSSTNCAHFFCEFCIVKHLSLRNNCPICRENVTFVFMITPHKKKDLKNRLDLPTIIVRIRYKKQTFEFPLLEQDISYQSLSKKISKLLFIPSNKLKIVHEGKLLNQENFNVTSLKLKEKPILMLQSSGNQTFPSSIPSDSNSNPNPNPNPSTSFFSLSSICRFFS